MKQRFLRVGGLLVVLIVVGLLSTALVTAQEDALEPIELHIHMGEFYFQLAGQEQGEPITLEAGQPYELVFINDGNVLHEVLMGQNVMTVDGLADGYEINFLDDVTTVLVAEMADNDFEVVGDGFIEFEIAAEQTLVLEFTLPEEKIGLWEIGCFQPGHYENGMKMDINVVALGEGGSMPIEMESGSGSMDESTSAATEEGPVIELQLGEFYFRERGSTEENVPLELVAGVEYTLIFENEGDVLHEVIAGQGLQMIDGAPDGYETLLLDASIPVEVLGEVAGEEFEVILNGLQEFEIDVAQTLIFKFTIPEDRVGEWEMGCFQPAHYENGMKIPVIVTAPE